MNFHLLYSMGIHIHPPPFSELKKCLKMSFIREKMLVRNIPHKKKIVHYFVLTEGGGPDDRSRNKNCLWHDSIRVG